MKKLMIALGLAAAFSGSAFAEEFIISDEGGDGVLAPSVQPSFATENVGGGTLNFSGKVLSPTCTIKGGETHSIKLPDVMTSEIDGNISKSTKFDIVLTGCPSSNERSVALRFAPQTGTTDNLLNNSSNNGTNLALKLMNSNKQQINLSSNGNDGFSDIVPLTQQGDITYSFYAEYAKREITKPVLPGAFSATLPFYIIYK
ncbi:TPA: type 1 fimbrial protein [Pasteurella multocida]|nr:type 1 fimbrial protein [Pasteurella multocida]